MVAARTMSRTPANKKRVAKITEGKHRTGPFVMRDNFAAVMN